MRARAAKAGRDPDQMKILPGMVPIVAETKAMAEDKRKLIDDLADPQAGLSTLSYHLDIDLSQFRQDRVLPTLDVPGVQGHYKEVAEMTQRRGLTLSQTGKQYAWGRCGNSSARALMSPTSWKSGSAPALATASCCKRLTFRAAWRISCGSLFPNCKSANCSGATMKAQHCGTIWGWCGRRHDPRRSATLFRD
jgi:hypothetical protein